MTIGQKLHQCRTEAGLSQEEVAGRLLVSRQTISLWETDQTLPTIDNLIRLKELFGISVDELLTGEEREAEAPAAEPASDIIESFSYAPTVQDVKKVTGIIKRKDRLRYLWLLAFAALWLFMVFTDASSLSGMTFGMMLAAAIFYILNSIRLRRSLRRESADIASLVYNCCLKGSRLFIGTEKDGEELTRYCFDQDEVNYAELGGICEVITKQGVFPFGKNELYSAPRILNWLKGAAAARNYSQVSKSSTGVTVASILLVIAACLSLPLCAVLIGLADQYGMPQPILWLSLLLPLICLLFGIILKKRGYAVKRNIIIGAIFTGLAMLFCLGGALILKTGRAADAMLSELSEEHSVTLPEGTDPISMSSLMSDELCRITAGRVCMASLGLDGSGKKAYYSSDDRWIQGLPEELAPYVPEQFRTAPDSDAHYMLIDCDSGLVNTPPDGAGHRMVLFYVPESGYTIYAAEYTMEN